MIKFRKKLFSDDYKSKNNRNIVLASTGLGAGLGLGGGYASSLYNNYKRNKALEEYKNKIEKSNKNITGSIGNLESENEKLAKQNKSVTVSRPNNQKNKGKKGGQQKQQHNKSKVDVAKNNKTIANNKKELESLRKTLKNNKASLESVTKRTEKIMKGRLKGSLGKGVIAGTLIGSGAGLLLKNNN